jgi:polar amino acid transport system substrate-binding protein
MRSTLLLLIIIFTSTAASQTLTIAADEWYPMNGTPGANKPGYMIELANAIFSRHNITVQYSLLPWERAVEQTREGLYSCVVGAYHSDTPDFIFPKQHWGLDNPKFFIKKEDNWRYTGDVNSLTDRKVGLITGYSYTEAFDDYAKKQDTIHIQFTRGNNALETNIKKLRIGRIDTLVESAHVMNAKLKNLGIPGALKEAGNISAPVKMYMACTPKHQSSQLFVDIIDNEMKNLETSGELKTILKRYGLTPWKVE